MHDHPVISLVAQPLNVEHYDSLRSMAAEIHVYAPDARVLTTYYCGANCHPFLVYARVLCSCLFFLPACAFFFFCDQLEGDE